MFYLNLGKIELLYGEADEKALAHKIILNKGESFHVPAGLRHQMHALEDSELYEFSTQHLEEDSIRVEKGD